MNKTTVLAVCVAGLATSSASAANILVNADFETGALAPWAQTADFGGPENWNVTTVSPRSGNFSATSRGNKLIEQTFTPVATSLITEVSLWVRNMDASINAVFFRYGDGSTEVSPIFHTDTNWNFYNFTSFLDPGKTLTGFGIYGVSGGTTDRTYADDFTVNVIPAPASMALLGLGGLVAARRRRA